MTRLLMGASALAFPIREIKDAINEVLEKANDPLKLGKVNEDEIRKVLKLLGLEEYVYEAEEEDKDSD